MLISQVSPFDYFVYNLLGDTISKKIKRNKINAYKTKILLKEQDIDDISIVNSIECDKAYVQGYNDYKRDMEKRNTDDNKKEEKRIYKKIRRTNRNIIKAYCDLKDKCNYFITLTFSKLVDGYEETKVDYDAKREILSKFLRIIDTKTHNRCWFLIVVGNGSTYGIHFHIYAYLPTRKIKKVKRVVNNIWSEIIKKYWKDTINKHRNKHEKNKISDEYKKICDQVDVINNDNPTETRKFVEDSLKYVVSPDKNHEYKKLDAITGGAKRYSKKFSNRMNKFDKKTYKLSFYENEELCKFMIEYLENKESNTFENTDDCVTQLMKANGMVSFIPNEVWIEWFEKIISNRRGKSFKDMLIIQAAKIIKLKNKSSIGGKKLSEL